MNQPSPKPGAPPPLTYRPTGPGTFMVDDGDDYIGTVQEFTRTEWWAFPAGSTDTHQPATYRTKDAAGESLRARHAATKPVDLMSALVRSIDAAREARTEAAPRNA